MILKDRFLTQWAPDICHKLWKQAFGPNQLKNKQTKKTQKTVTAGSDYILWYIIWGGKWKAKKNQVKDWSRNNCWWICSETTWKKLPRGTQVKKDGLVITVERRDMSNGIALRHLKHPHLHVWSANDHIGEETVLWDVGPRCQTLKTIGTEGPWGSPHKFPS